MEHKIEAIKKYETYFGFDPTVLRDDSLDIRKMQESASKCIQNARTSLLFWRLKDYKNDTERITNLFKRPIQQISPVGITTKWFSLDIRKNNNIDLIQNIDVYLEEIANEEGKDKDYYKDLFAYRAFPALFVYFTIGEFIDIAFQMIDTNIGNVKGVIGKMISTFFAGFPQISCAFGQNIIRGYKETSDITKAVEIAFMEMPITLSKYHMEIIKKLWTSNNPEAIEKLIYDEV